MSVYKLNNIYMIYFYTFSRYNKKYNLPSVYLDGTLRPSESIIAPQNETHNGLNIGQMKFRKTRRIGCAGKDIF